MEFYFNQVASLFLPFPVLRLFIFFPTPHILIPLEAFPSISSIIPASVANPHVPASSCGSCPSVKEALLPTLPVRRAHIERLSVWSRNPELHHYGGDPLMQPTLHTRPQSGNAHEHKSTKALAARLSAVHNTADAMFPFRWNNAFLLGAFMAWWTHPRLALPGRYSNTRGGTTTRTI